MSRHPFFAFGPKLPASYKNIPMLADPELHEQVVELLRHSAPPSKGVSILDLGAGKGAFTQRLIDLGYRVTAADIDKSDFQATGADFYQIDFNDPQATSSFVQKYALHFDVVIGMEVVEHVENPWDYIRLLLSLLKPQGLLLLTTPNITSRLSRLIFFFTGRFHQFSDSDLAYGHIAPITSWTLRLIMERSGLNDITIAPAGTLPYVWITSSLRFSLLNFLGSLFRPLMRGQKDGWCIVAMGRKP